jgi:hypothetical protein
MKCVATATDTPGEDPRFGARGKQKCEDTGPLTKKRMETIDEEFLNASMNFIDRATRDKKPFFVWFNPSRMHIRTRLKMESQGRTGLCIYPDGMVEHDGQVGRLLKELDDLAIANNTIVIYTTDNGAETFSWPDGGTTPFRGEKNTNWEGGYRVPAMIRWPGVAPPRTEINDIFSAEDWATTLVAMALPPPTRSADFCASLISDISEFPTCANYQERTSGFQINFPELLRRGAELAELVNGRACGRESERLKRFGEQLVEVDPGREAGADMRIEMLARGFWNERRNVFDQERINDAIVGRRDERA